jgi:flagellar protein FliO/FliZ
VTSIKAGVLILLGGLATPAWAATNTTTSVATVLISLVLILGGFALVAWLARRYLPGLGGTQGAVKVVGATMVGPRERVVVIEVEDARLVLGVGGGQVRLLHTLPRAATGENRVTST